ncbi:sushi, von Willebrand factor type A, EGF and pentraxin domain-containing protein 1-like [Halichondria panicea]|uniref:sushi, von Willebrand factor type A, EGF and pentraxin domain-containing protein 1-like n=1 Tax=Halichondria panicea TaxID=6063 RepID=UPI00312BAA11
MATVTLFLCSLLGSVSLVYGQTSNLIRLASPTEPSGTDHTGEIISFSDVGSGVGTNPRAWYCYTDPAGVVWQGPGGSTLPIVLGRAAVDDELFISGINIPGAVVLHRGPMHFSPDGEYCCVRSAQDPAQRRCVTFTPCPTLSPLSNGRISYNATTNMATYTCDTGYTISGATPITCMSDGTSAGTWSPSPPAVTCTIVTCPVLTSPTNGALSTTSRDYLTVVTYSCDTGYVLTGNSGSARTCQATGQWSGVAPTFTCPPVDCGSLATLFNGVVDTSSGTTFMMTATYTCNTGYNIVGSESRTCGASGTSGATTPSDGVWSPAAPVFCEIVNCGSLDDPSNGAVDTSSGTAFLQRATYTCNPGYTLTGGDMTRTCQVNGMWSSSEPACEFIVLSIGGTVYNTNNTALSFSLIGEGSSALTCHTELSTCCREQDNPNGGTLGGWRGPDGVSLPSEADFGATAEGGFYVTRGVSTISLNRRGTVTFAGGLYCCTIPRASGANQTFCVDVQVPISATEPASTYTDGPTVALGVLLAFSFVGNIVFIALLIVGRKRTQTRSELSDHETYRKEQQQPVYEAPDQVAFYEDVSKLSVSGPPTAIELSECPAYASTESGGGQRREEHCVYDN